MDLELSAATHELNGLYDEQDLVERAKQDREAFALLYRHHAPVMGNYIFRRVGDAHLTEDLLADVFMIALQHLKYYRHRGLSIRSWLYRIACNRVNRWAKRERRKLLKQLETEPMAFPNSSMEETGSDYARAALLTLSTKYQTVITLHYLEGLSLEDVARAVGCRLGTVKSRLARGREALREKLRRSQS